MVFPDLDGVMGAADLERVVGALLTFVLVVAVLMTVVCAAAWGIGHSHGNLRMADRARTGMWVAGGSAIAAGVMTAWLNALLGVGASL